MTLPCNHWRRCLCKRSLVVIELLVTKLVHQTISHNVFVVSLLCVGFGVAHEYHLKHGCFVESWALNICISLKLNFHIHVKHIMLYHEDVFASIIAFLLTLEESSCGVPCPHSTRNHNNHLSHVELFVIRWF